MSTPTPGYLSLSLHDALPISGPVQRAVGAHVVGSHPALALLTDGVEPLGVRVHRQERRLRRHGHQHRRRSEEHTSELQSRGQLVCRLLLEKKKNTKLC